MLTPAADLVKRATYRKAIEKDLPWINEHYASVNFEPSKLPGEEIWLAESMGRPIGVGRLIELDSKTSELGGLFVLETFRKYGVSRQLIERLLASVRAKPSAVYCIPLNHLVEYYKGFGFVNFGGSLEMLPERLRAKFKGCGQTHDVKHLLWLPIKD